MKSVGWALAAFATVTLAQNCPSGYAPHTGSISATQNITWTACPVTDEPTLECGTIEVPADYTNSSSPILTLALVRVPANASQANGKSIVYNPGGPGASGIESLIGQGEDLVILAGGAHNLITFDPRGVGLTDPYQCPTVTPVRGSSLPLDDPVGLNATYVTNKNQGDVCAMSAYKASGEIIGTAFVARDINAIFQALNEDGMIRYWGFSYGTLLGSTLAAMFPDKIDRMVLDGNINPTDYYHGLNEESVDNVDAGLLYFFESCAAAGPTYCDLAIRGYTGEELQEIFYEFLYGVKNDTYITYNSAGEQMLYTDISSYVYSSLKSPRTWPTVAQNISVYYGLAAHGSASTHKRAAPFDPLLTLSISAPLSLYGITCGDWDDINANLNDFESYLKLYQARSKFGGDQLISILYQCSTWSVNAKEQFDGKFANIKTKAPLLFVNGPYDPVTPLISAQNSSSGFVGSKVLRHTGAGHCSTAHPSTCVQQKITSYFKTGVLPDTSIICSPNQAPFSGEILVSVNGTGSVNSSSTSSSGKSEEEERYERAVENVANLLKPRDPSFEYPHVLRDLVQKRQVLEGSRIFGRQASSTTQLVPATCTPASGSKNGSARMAVGALSFLSVVVALLML